MDQLTQHTSEFDTEFEAIKSLYASAKYKQGDFIVKAKDFISKYEYISGFDLNKILITKNYLANCYYWQGEINEARALNREVESFVIAGKTNNKVKIYTMIFKAYFNFYNSNFHESISITENILNSSVKLSDKLPNNEHVSLITILASAYYELGYYHKALLNYFKVNSLLDNQTKQSSIVNYNIVCCFLKQGRYNAAFEHLSLNEIRINNTRDPFVKLMTFMSKTIAFLEIKEFQKCICHAEESLKLTKNLDRKLLNGAIYLSLAKAYIGLSQFDKAADYAILLHQFSVENNIRNNIVEGLGIIAKIMMAADKVPQAIESYEKLSCFNHDIGEILIHAESIINELEILPEKLMISELLLEYSIKQQKYEQAVYYFKIIRQIESKIFDIRKNDLEFHLESEFKQNQHLRDLEHQQQLLKEQKEISNRLEGFARTVSHDMKEPLRNIRSFSQLLRRKNNELSADSFEYLDFIIDASKRMNQQIDDLLHYAQLGVNMPESVEVNLNDILILTRRNLHQQISESKAELQHDILPFVMGHPSLLSSLFQNLISNSIKFKKPNEDCIIKIEFIELRNNFIQFSIIDNGIGMPPNMLQAIFMTFKRLHSYADYQGSGVGLATCKKTVELYGGKIWAESEEGIGSKFHFTLPKVYTML